METYQEWKKRKYGDGTSSKAPEVSSSSGKKNPTSSGTTVKNTSGTTVKKTSGVETYEEWKNRKSSEGTLFTTQQNKVRNGDWGDTQSRLERYMTASKDYFDYAPKAFENMTYSNASDVLAGRTQTAEQLRSEGRELLKWFNEYGEYLDKDTYKEVSQYLRQMDIEYGNVMKSFGEKADFFGQFETEDDYLKWDAYSTPEKRQERYSQNQARLAELEKEREELLKNTSPEDLHGGRNNYVWNMATSGFNGTPDVIPAGAQKNLTSEIDKEIASIKAEMEMYERGNTDEAGFYYGSKVVDDYGKVLSDPNYGKFSAGNYQNPTRETMQEYDALADPSGWYRDANGILYDSRGVKIDETPDANGNIQSPLASEDRYTVTDPLGMYLNTSEAKRNEALSLADGMDGIWEAHIRDGYYGNWEQLTEGEVGIYYTLLGTKGKDAAMQYLTDMTTELNRRNMISETERYNDEFAEAGDLKRIAMSLASSPAQLLGGATGFLDDLGHTLRGEDINPYSAAHSMSNYAQTVRSNQAQALNEATGNIAIPFINFTVGDLYQAGMSAVDMGVGGLLGGTAYGALMGMGAASSEARRLYEMGASNEQIAWGAGLAGAAEMVFEKYSIENLINLKDADTLGKLVMNALIQGGVEASEEGFTEIANTITNALVMGSESDWAKLLEQTDGDAAAALAIKAQEVGKAAFSGFVSGGFGGSGSSVVNYAANSHQNAQTGKVISESGSTDALVALAKEMAGSAPKSAQRNLTKQSERLGKDFLTEGGKNRATGRLYNTVRSLVTEQNIKDISTALQEKGISKKDATAIAGAVAVQANGMELTKDQQSVLKKFESNADVQSTVNEILDNQESGINQRARSVAKFEFDTIRNQITSRMKQAAPGQENKTSEGNLTDADNATSESHYEVSAEGKTIIKSTGEIANIKEVANIKNGRMTLMLEDGSTVDSEDVSYSSEAEALVYETVARMDVTTKAANILVNGFKSTQGNALTASEYAHGIEEAFRYGELGIPTSGLSQSSFAHKLTPAVQDFVYRQGKKAAGRQVARDQATVKKSLQVAQAALASKSEASEKSYSAVLDDGISAMSLNESQKASYRMADHIAQAASVNIRVYAGKTGEHGYYNPKTDEIHLNLNATNKTRQSMMAFTLGHELVHRAKKGSPAKYKAFANFLMEQYGKQGANVEAMIAEELAAAKEFNVKMTYEQAFEEVVCDACQRMLLDTNAGQKLAEFGAQSRQNKSFLEDLKRWITEFMDKLRSIFVNVEPDSMAAKEFAKFDANVKQILADIYVDMAIDAGENLSTIQNAFGKGTVVKTNEHGEFTMAQSADGSEKVFNLVTWKNGGRETLEATLLREGYTAEEVKAALTIMDGKQALVESIANELDGNGKMAFPEQGRINEATLTTDIKDGHAVLSALVSNGDYPVNIDLLMVCKKRKAYQRVINRLCETGMIKEATVDALAIAEINKILGKYGFETACLGCFVESRRLRIQEWAQTIVKEWNGEVKKRNPNAKPFGFGKGKATLTPDEVMQLIGELESGGEKNDQGNLNLGQGSAVKRMGVLLDKVPSLRRTLTIEDLITPDGLSSLRRFDSNLFSMVKSRYGSNSPKFVQEFNPYNHELAKYGKVPSQYNSLREYLYAIGGARMQSFSDFIVENWFDYCQIVADLAARKLPMHTYTKEIALAKLFGMTGIKINMSLIPDVDRSMGKDYAGLTRNAKGELEPIWADKDRFKATGGKSYMQSINFADAMALQNDPRYSANVGTIAIGVSDIQIRMMLNDPRIRMVIPYHSSGMNPIFADLMGTSFYKDYTNFQNTTVKQMYDSKGRPVSVKLDKTQTGKLTSGFQFNEALQELGDARAAAEAYKEWCADASLHTITIKGDTYTAELTPKFDDFSGDENYYKLLEDFNPYDCITEQATPQGDVQQIYPEGFEKILKAELAAQEGHRQKQIANQAFDKAMADIEAYLKDHTKADTVHYANQHGIKLGAKDKKLGAEDKAKLKRLQEEGASFSLPKSDQKKITLSTTDSERTEILKDKVITAEVYEGQADNSIDRENDGLESTQIGIVKAALKRIADEFGVFVDYAIEDVEVKFTFSQSNLEESVSKKITPKAVAKLMPVLKTAVEKAIGIESHANRYYYDTDIVRFDNLVGGYIEGDSFVPVRFGLKHRRNGEVILYVIVDQQKIKMDKIKAEVVKITGQDKLGQETSRSAYRFSIPSIIPFVNGGDLLRYLPDDMLNASQKEIKWDAVADTIKRTNDKNDRKYAKYIREGKLRTAEQMVQQAAKMNGYSGKAYHQTSSVFTEFSTNNPVAGKNDSETPNGIFLKTNDHDIGLGGNIQMKMYFKADNMLHFADRKEANAWYCKNVPGYDALQQELEKALKPYLDQIDAITEQEWDESKSDEEIDALFEEEDRVIKAMGKVEDSYRARLRKLLDQYFLRGESGYDGIELDYDGHRWVNGKREDVHTFIVFHPSQVKSADAITYDDNGDIIPISQRFNPEKNDIRYKLPVGEDTSPRALLSNAFETIVTNPIEKRKLQEYKENVAMLNEEEAKLRELRAQIKELSFAKGKRDTKKIRDLQFDANQAANRIATLDKMLLRFEASAPLQNILQREKDMVRKRERQRTSEALDALRKAERERSQHRYDDAKERYKESRKKVIETREKREATEKLQRLVIDTAKWISYPSKTDVKCPDILKQPYADFLKGIDLSSKRLANGGDPNKNDLRLASSMDSLATALERIMMSQDPNQDANTVLDTGYLDLPAGFVQKLRDMTENVKAMMVEGDYVVNNMSAAEVRQLSQMIRTLNHAIKEVSTLYANLRFANVEALGDNTISFMDDIGEIEKTSGAMDFVEWENALPYYAFKRFGNGGESIFEGLMDAQDKLAFLAQQIFDFQEKAWTGDEAKAWSEDSHTIDLPDGDKLTLTTADAMSIYCLSRRKQGLQHLLGGGVRVMGIQKGSQKAKDSRSILSIKDIDAINSSLTDRQKKVAEALQEFMSTVCSEWGNEISMKRFLTREFTEKFYFPIESNDENLSTKDPAAQQSDLFRLLNISATKPVDPNANNEVIIRNVFDVFTGHASDMARLNAFGMPLLDYMKWLNYREKMVNEAGQVKVRGVRKSMETAYGNAAKSYVLNLIKDVNGRASDGGDPSILMKWMRTAKTASVGSSLRVATLQLTSYPRAALVLSPNSLRLGLSKLPNIQKAKKYCGIALWKSFGFYDTNISRSIEDQMKGVKDVRQKLIEWSLKGAELGDALTWGALWNACEYEVAATKRYKVGSEEFNQAVGKKLREVVYRTQVVDSTLTRSQIMRSKRGMAQEAAAFMSEPTLSANILMDAGFEFNLEKRRTGSVKAAWEKTGKYIGRAVAVYSIGQLTAALLEGLWDALRDDEDEEFGKKYIDAFVENLALDLVPFNKIPIVSDIFEAALAMFDVGFYSSDRMSTTWLTQAVSAVDAWKKVLGGETSTTVYNAMYKSVRALSSFYGVSFSGVMREGVTFWNVFAGSYDSTLKIRQYQLTKGELGNELYEAIISGDTRQAESLKGQFDDQKAISSAIRKALRENDPRIRDAAIAWNDNDLDEYMRIAREIIGEKHFAQDDVVLAIRAEASALATDDGETGTSKAKGLFTPEKFAEAIAQNDEAMANAIRTDIIQTAQKNGDTESEAEESFNSSAKGELQDMYVDGKISDSAAIDALVDYCGLDQDDSTATVKKWSFEVDYGFAYSNMKDEFIADTISASQAQNALMEYGGKDQDDAENTVKEWEFLRDYGFEWDNRGDAYKSGEISRNDLRTILINEGGMTGEEADLQIQVYDWEVEGYDGATVAAVREYNEHCATSRVPKDTYLYIRKFANNTENDVVNGKTVNYSAVQKIMREINAQRGLTSAQKTALARSMGWKESTIQKYKLW